MGELPRATDRSRWPGLPVSLDLPGEVYPSEAFPQGRRWPYGDGSLDAVLWFHSHERWFCRETLFAESARVLNPGGQVVIVGFHPVWSRLLRAQITAAGVEPGFRPVRVGWLVNQLAGRDFEVRTRLHGVRWPGAFSAPGSVSAGPGLEIGVPLIYGLVAMRHGFVKIPGPGLKPATDVSHRPIILPSRRVA